MREAVIGLWLVAALLAPATTARTDDRVLPGHSHYGAAFDRGPRQRAYLMGGTGNVHFPVSSRNPLVQKFIEQGIGQLHGFWFVEAERRSARPAPRSRLRHCLLGHVCRKPGSRSGPEPAIRGRSRQAQNGPVRAREDVHRCAPGRERVPSDYGPLPDGPRGHGMRGLATLAQTRSGRFVRTDFVLRPIN